MFVSQKSSSNKINFIFDCLDFGHIAMNPVNIYIKIASGANVLTDGAGQVDGVNITATFGGTACIVGDDFESLGDDDTVTLIANVCVEGYAFSHWENAAGDNIGTDSSIRLAKSVVMNNIIKAVFVPVDDSLINTDKNN